MLVLDLQHKRLISLPCVHLQQLEVLQTLLLQLFGHVPQFELGRPPDALRLYPLAGLALRADASLLAKDVILHSRRRHLPRPPGFMVLRFQILDRYRFIVNVAST